MPHHIVMAVVPILQSHNHVEQHVTPWQLAIEVAEVWCTKIRPKLSDQKQQTNIDLFNTDATKFNWSDATVVFCNSTCFDGGECGI